MGWHVAKIGDRYAAAQAVGMAVKTVFGAAAGGIARGVALRHDHGSPFMADHFRNQNAVSKEPGRYTFNRCWQISAPKPLHW